MSRKVKLVAVIAVALSTVGMVNSADAHIGGRGGGIRIGGGGLIPRARQGNANGNRPVNPPVASRTAPAPKPAVAPPVVQSNKLPAVASTATTNKPSTTKANVAPKSTDKVQPSSAPVQTTPPAPANVPAKEVIAAEPVLKKPVSSANQPSHLVFNLTGDPIAEDAPADRSTSLSLETRQALEDALADDSGESTPAEVAKKELAKEVPLPQVPVGATITLNGNDLSDKEGQVVLQIGEIALPATITAWKNDRVTCTLPVLGLTKNSRATLHVLKADGKTASMFNCELVTVVPTDSKFGR